MNVVNTTLYACAKTIESKNKDPKTRKARKVIRKYKIRNITDIQSIKEQLKQKLQVKAQMERRFDKRNKFCM